MKLQELQGINIGILGFGIEGQDTYHYLKDKGFSTTIIDRQEKEIFCKEFKKFQFSDSELVLGEKYLDSLGDFDLIFKTPGIPIGLLEIQKAIKTGTVFTSQIEFFFDNTPAQIIGVTGTKGKGTTSSLIFDILERSKVDVWLGGNIGLSAISFLDKLTAESVVILELSSFQLQTLEKSPHIAVVLNITSDHLDYHKSVAEYQEAKMNLVKFQKKQDFAVVNYDYEIPRSFAKATKAQVFYFSKKKPTRGCYVAQKEILLETANGIVEIANTNELLIRGEHNFENVTAAVLAAYMAGADIKSIRDGVVNFRSLEHRLELVRDFKGIKYYNDSFSTVPETAIAAIKSFSEPKVLILGGSDKGSCYQELGRVIEKSNIKAIIFIGDTTKAISKAIGPKYKGDRVFGLTKMPDIVSCANSHASSGDVVILTPASASFGLFENYKDRGFQFKEAVFALG